MAKKPKKAKKAHRPAKKIKKLARPRKVQKKASKSPFKKPVPVEKKILVGTVLHYFTNISVGVIKTSRTMKTGDKIFIQGSTTNFKQKVESMQKDGKPISEAHKGDSIGLKVKGRVREKDMVFIIN